MILTRSSHKGSEPLLRPADHPKDNTSPGVTSNTAVSREPSAESQWPHPTCSKTSRRLASRSSHAYSLSKDWLLFFLSCPLQEARWLAAGFVPAPPLSLVVVSAQRAPARPFCPGLYGECLLCRVSGCPRVPSSFARPELSCSRRPERRGRAVLRGPGDGGRAQPGAARETKPSWLSDPGALTASIFPPQVYPPEPISTAQPCCCCLG